MIPLFAYCRTEFREQRICLCAVSIVKTLLTIVADGQFCYSIQFKNSRATRVKSQNNAFDQFPNFHRKKHIYVLPFFILVAQPYHIYCYDSMTSNLSLVLIFSVRFFLVRFCTLIRAHFHFLCEKGKEHFECQRSRAIKRDAVVIDRHSLKLLFAYRGPYIDFLFLSLSLVHTYWLVFFYICLYINVVIVSCGCTLRHVRALLCFMVYVLPICVKISYYFSRLNQLKIIQ